MKGPEAFVQHLNTHQYHPRSDAHSNALCLSILHDLLDHCIPLVELAKRGEIVATLNHTVTVNYQRWNIDLALGPPPGTPQPPEEEARISMATPTVVEIALEAKGVMTEHGKARNNRLRDLHAFHNHAHTYNPKVVTGGIVVVNMAPIYWSPTRDVSDLTVHHNIKRIAEGTVDLYRNLPLRNSASGGPGIEGACVLVVQHDNLRKNEHPPADAPKPKESMLVEKAPAPPTGDPLHYATMIHRLCSAYRDRWC